MTQQETPEPLLRLASQLGRAGRLAEAIETYQQALRLRPQLPDSWYNLAHLQERAGRYPESLSSYQQALDRGVTRPEEVHLNRAVILATRMARVDDAEQAFRQALALNPAYLPAWLNLANLHEQRGDLAAALAAYQQLLRLDPEHALALARVVSLEPRSRLDDPVLQRVRMAIANPRTNDNERADLGFGLGKALDGIGAYDEAFAAYQAANRATRMGAGPNGAIYDRAGHERWVDQIIRMFPRPAADATAADVDATPPGSGGISPVFICGMFRSGSTLVEQVLSVHPQVTTGGELELLPALVRERLDSLRSGTAMTDPQLLQSLREAYLAGIALRHPGAGLVTDKRPDNFLYIGLIKTLFPQARIIHTRRDPMDNCLSVFFLHLTHAMPYALDLLDIAHWYRQYRRLMQHWHAIYPGEIHDLAYDDLVAEPRPVIERLLQYCGLPWDEACMHFHQSRSVVQTASVWQVRKPLYTGSSGRWRHYERHLADLRAALVGMPG